VFAVREEDYTQSQTTWLSRIHVTSCNRQLPKKMGLFYEGVMASGGPRRMRIRNLTGGGDFTTLGEF